MAGSAPGPGGAAATFGQRLRALREVAGLSQEELAERAGVSTDAVSSLERGTRAHPYPATVRALAGALALPPQEQSALIASVPRRSRAGVRGSTASGSRAGALPVAATPLLGRDDDVTAVAELITGTAARLVTLTGAGGIGKSRLAVAVAERLASRMRDGTAFVALAPVLDEALLLPEVERALGLDDAGGSGGDDSILSALGPLEVLLVLDNFEHLAGAARLVGELLAHCPGMTLLVTSRAPLRVRGEIEYPVPPLGLPEADATDPAALADSPAAALLLQRGRAVRRDLPVRPEDVPSVVGICHRLAGLPLALELAAVGLRVLDPAALLARLDEVLAREGPLDLPARQRSLQASLDWSHGLLSAPDRVAFRRLSVFSGGFTLEAADAVLDHADVLGVVERLVSQALCTVTTGSDGRLRHGMLEPIGQYARSLLTGEEEAEARLRHAEHFLRLAEQGRQALHHAQQVEFLGRFGAEESNLWAAVEWALQTGRAELAGRFVASLSFFWYVRGPRRRARELIDRVLTLELPDHLRARALHGSAALSAGVGPPEELERRYREALALAERCADPKVEADASIGLGAIALQRGDPATAEAWFERGLHASRRADESATWNIGLAHALLGAAKRFRGQPTDAVSHLQAGLLSARERGDLVTAGLALYNLGQAELALGELHPAREHLVDAVLLCQQTGDASNLSGLLDALAAVESRTSSTERVVTLLGAAQALREAVGFVDYSWYPPDIEQRLRTAEEARRRLGEDAYGRALEAGRSLSLAGAVELARSRGPTGGPT